MTEESWFNFRQGLEFYLLKNPGTSPGAHTTLTIHVFFLGGKRPECEAAHSPPSSAEVKDEWSYTFLTVNPPPPPHVPSWH
jgi:hypothetical protein